VRPFRLAAFALAGPLVAFESLVAGAGTLRAALEPDLGTLTVSPFGVLSFEPAGGGTVAGGPPVAGVGRRAAGAPPARRPAARGGGTQSRSVTRPAGEAPDTAEGAGAGSVGAGAAAAAAEDAIAAGTSLLGTLADAAMDVVVPPPKTARSEQERKSSAPRSPRPPAAGGLGRSLDDLGLDDLLDDVVTANLAESILPGTGGVAVATGAAVETGAALLDELAETALAAFAGPKAPAAGPKASAAGRPTTAAAPAPRRRAPGAPRETVGAGGSTVGDLVLRGLGAIGTPPTGPPAPASGTTTLDELASAAIAALAPSGGAPTAQDGRPTPRPRSEGETAVARALDDVQAAATAANAAATGGVRAAATEKKASPSELQPPAAAAPSDLAWLVNEALVEQARRHGVDLS
jgi:hypothetical protein